jgi:hypothetical protein
MAALAIAIPTWGVAQDSEADQLFETLRLSETIEIMRLEGQVFGYEIGTDMFSPSQEAEWQSTVDGIYDQSKMEQIIRATFTDAVENKDVGPLLDFFGSDRGESILDLELSARSAMLDSAIEEAATARALEEIANNTPRYVMVSEFIEANDLLESNVVSAMNSSYAFYIGLLDGGAFGDALSQEQILNDVWSQEGEIRANTLEWIYAFGMLAYEPLSDDDLDAYIAFSESEAGTVMNTTLFSTFNPMFEDISRALGLEAARFMTVQEL